MAYYSGTATSLANLLANFLTNAQADGWTLTGNVLSKAGVYFQLTSDANNIKILGCESNAVANPAPHVLMIGTIFQRSGLTTRRISFPCNYEVFGFAQEIYLVVNYDTDSYQWMAFGKSTVPGLPGQSGWCGANIGSQIPGIGSYASDAVSMDSNGAGMGFGFGIPALMFSCFSPAFTTAWNYHVNSGLDGHGWSHVNSATPNYNAIGIKNLAPLYAMQPNTWNSEATLLPIRCFKERPSYKSSLTADLQYARHMRIDNLAPGDILTIGSDKWKVFPWYRKNAAARNGGQDINHSGTFGWAIKYEGP